MIWEIIEKLYPLAYARVAIYGRANRSCDNAYRSSVECTYFLLSLCAVHIFMILFLWIFLLYDLYDVISRKVENRMERRKIHMPYIISRELYVQYTYITRVRLHITIIVKFQSYIFHCFEIKRLMKCKREIIDAFFRVVGEDIWL